MCVYNTVILSISGEQTPFYEERWDPDKKAEAKGAKVKVYEE